MPTKNKFIVLDTEDSMDSFDVHTLELNHRSDVKKIAGVIFRDTRKAHRYPPVFYYDSEGYITGFEGWGWDEGVDVAIPADMDLSVLLVTL